MEKVLEKKFHASQRRPRHDFVSMHFGVTDIVKMVESQKNNAFPDIFCVFPKLLQKISSVTFILSLPRNCNNGLLSNAM